MTGNTENTIIPPMENTAETMRKTMEKLSHHDTISLDQCADPIQAATLITLPQGRTVNDLTPQLRNAAEFLKPARRMGTAHFDDLGSLISWANRFKGPTSALFAKPDLTAPTITCIADYHAQGGPAPDNPLGDPTARHCHHRAIYNFPLSEEWKAWNRISGNPLEKDDLGEFIEANAKDIMAPTAAVLKQTESDKNQPWENRLIKTAQQIQGRYGQLTQLLAMSRQFQVHETSDLTVTSNRDTGETSIQFLNEHKGADGKPLNIPNLIIIAIPVFMGGAPYRMPVRFRYRKMGGAIRFILSIYNPERAFSDAFAEALAEATDATGLPTFKGTPEKMMSLSGPCFARPSDGHQRGADMKNQIGRLAMRAEGTQWNAYYASTTTLDGAVFLGSIALAAITQNPDRRQAFMDMMKDIVSDIIEEKTGQRPSWKGQNRAPEHERAGRA